MAAGQPSSRSGFGPDAVPGVLVMPWAALGLRRLGVAWRPIHRGTITVSAVFNRPGPIWLFFFPLGLFFLKVIKKKKKEGRHCLISNSRCCKMKSEW